MFDGPLSGADGQLASSSEQSSDHLALLASVLIVDDDPRKLAALESILAPLELRVATAQSGADALRILLKEAFGLIVLDVRMPDLDGFETATLIRQRAQTERTPIIFVTAFSQAEADIKRGYELGAIDFVTSPIVPEVFRAKVEAITGLQADRMRLLEQVASARKEAESAAAYLSMTAHEIRGPIAVIGGYLAMLVDRSLGSDSAAWAQVLETLVLKTHEADKLAADLLLAAKAEFPSGADASVDLDTAARLACERAKPRASLLGSSIEFAGVDRPLGVFGDPSDVGRILDNLINNALSYSPDMATVEVRVIESDFPRVEVKDHGHGVPLELQGRIFEPFFRVAHNRQAPGSGLGLHLSRKLAGRYQGTVELVASEPDRGSTFALCLRRLATSGRATGSAPRRSARPGPSDASRTPRTLTPTRIDASSPDTGRA